VYVIVQGGKNLSDKEDLLLQLAEASNDTEDRYADDEQGEQGPSLLERWIDWANAVDA
jgi:hypothetical protein